MDINAAKCAFKNIIKSLDNEDRTAFLSWCEENCAEVNCSPSYFELRTIAEDIKTMVPVEGILPSEVVDHSQMESSSNRNRKPILHVDSFLFEEEHIDALEAEGKIKRNYCEKCGSLEVAPITFISHSLSVKRIQYIFEVLLPNLSGKTFLDVGSRLGSALYGAYYCSSAQKIIGVEMNEDFCKLQNHIINKYNLNDRIQVIWSNIIDVPGVVQSADVILLNNVFRCFASPEIQQKYWHWLKNNVRSGTLIVTIPSIEENLCQDLQTCQTSEYFHIDISKWLKLLYHKSSSIEDTKDGDDPDLLSEIFCYEVL